MTTLITKDLSLRNVCNDLGRISHKWFKLGIQLGISRAILKQFAEEHDPFSAVLNHWLEGLVTDPAVPVSWTTIVDVLKTDSIDEKGIAEKVDRVRCRRVQTKVERGTGESLVEKKPPENTEGKLHPDVEMDLNFILEKNLDELITRYASYVDTLRGLLSDDRGLTAEELRTFLMSLPAFVDPSPPSSPTHTHTLPPTFPTTPPSFSTTSTTTRGKPPPSLPLMYDKRDELAKKKTVTEVFTFLTTQQGSFFNPEIFHTILEHYSIGEERERLQYRPHFKFYIDKHKVCEYARVGPRLKPRIGLQELVFRYDVENTCRLAEIYELKRYMAKVFGLNPLALSVVEFEETKEVVVTFLIPVSVAQMIFGTAAEPGTITTHQENQLKAAKIMWLKCNGRTFHFTGGDDDSDSDGDGDAVGESEKNGGDRADKAKEDVAMETGMASSQEEDNS